MVRKPSKQPLSDKHRHKARQAADSAASVLLVEWLVSLSRKSREETSAISMPARRMLAISWLSGRLFGFAIWKVEELRRPTPSIDKCARAAAAKSTGVTSTLRSDVASGTQPSAAIPRMNMDRKSVGDERPEPESPVMSPKR